MQSASPRRGLLAMGACGLILLVAAPAASASESQGRAAHPDAAATVATAAANKPCRKVRVKKRTKSGRVVRRHGKPVYVMRKKCKKPVSPPAVPSPAPAPGPAPAPAPAPVPGGPRIDQILGWSTLAVDPDTPPADMVADGGTMTSCPDKGGLSVYISRSGFTSTGLVSHEWKLDGKTVASGTNSSTTEGNFRYELMGSTLPNGRYEITWKHGGTTIAKASVTRAC